LSKNLTTQIDINVDDILSIDMSNFYPVLYEINKKTFPRTEATFNRRSGMSHKGRGWSISSLIKMGDLVDITKSIERDKRTVITFAFAKWNTPP
jgi:hypothetical protein